jgi:hypothetical protein
MRKQPKSINPVSRTSRTKGVFTELGVPHRVRNPRGTESDDESYEIAIWHVDPENHDNFDGPTVSDDVNLSEAKSLLRRIDNGYAGTPQGRKLFPSWFTKEFMRTEREGEALWFTVSRLDSNGEYDLLHVRQLLREPMVQGRTPARKSRYLTDAEEAAERRERAMEAGALHGIHAYNEAMGYDSYSPDEYDHYDPYGRRRNPQRTRHSHHASNRRRSN